MVVAAPRDPSMLRFVMDEFQPSNRGGPKPRCKKLTPCVTSHRDASQMAGGAGFEFRGCASDPSASRSIRTSHSMMGHLPHKKAKPFVAEMHEQITAQKSPRADPTGCPPASGPARA